MVPRSTDAHQPAAGEGQTRWNRYAVFSVLTRPQAALLTRFDAYEDAELQSKLLEDPEQAALLAQTLVQLFPNSCVERADLVHVLELIHTMLRENPIRSALFRDLKMINPFKRLLGLLCGSDDNTIVQLASEIYALIIWPGCGARLPCLEGSLVQDLTSFVLANLLSLNCPFETVTSLLGSLQILLRHPELRAEISQVHDLGCKLPVLLERCTGLLFGVGGGGVSGGALVVNQKYLFNTNLVYRVLFCLWLLSYDPASAAQMALTDLIRPVMQLLKVGSPVKLVRMCARLCRNLVLFSGHIQQILSAGGLQLFATLSSKRIDDTDMEDDIVTVLNALSQQVQVLSSLDTYTSELLADAEIEWTAVRASEAFFRENARAIGSGEAGRLLSRLLKSRVEADDTRALAVLCHDIGQVCRFCPKSSKQWEDDAMEGGVSTKELVLRLIQHECKEVSLHALRCAQKMMCVNWELAAATTNKII